MLYSPFDSDLTTLDATDLQRLVEQAVAEGYYVEYKETLPSNNKIGHSVASFANTYGGWYMVGVRANAQHVAVAIPGFSLSDFPDPVSKVRDVIKSHISPIPAFHPRLVPLQAERAVLVVYIPGEQDTPFITKDGRIYRRNHDSSDPVSETDRYAVDRLIDLGRQARDRFARFCRDERTFSKAEAHQGWVCLFISPQPPGIVDKTTDISLEGLKTLIQSSQAPTTVTLVKGAIAVSGSVPLTAAQPTHESVILRQIHEQGPAFNWLEVELFADGRVRFFIPLEYLPDILSRPLEKFESEKVRGVFPELVASGDAHRHLKFFNISRLWQVIAFLLNYYFEWLGHADLIDEVRVALQIKDVWRSVAFFDADEWADHTKEFGLPVVQRERMTIPWDIGRGMVISRKEDDRAWLTLSQVTALAFGLPPELHAQTIARAVAKAMPKK